MSGAPVRVLPPGQSGFAEEDVRRGSTAGANKYRASGKRGAFAKHARTHDAAKFDAAANASLAKVEPGRATEQRIAAARAELAAEPPKRRGRPPGVPNKPRVAKANASSPKTRRAGGARAARVAGEVAVHPGALAALGASGVTLDVVTCRCGVRHRVLLVIDPCAGGR